MSGVVKCVFGISGGCVGTVGNRLAPSVAVSEPWDVLSCHNVVSL